MTDTETASSAADVLRAQAPGRVFLPSDAGYEDACRGWNTSALLRPAAVGLPETVAEVQALMRVAADAGMRVAPISTGHAAGLLAASDLSDALMLRLSGLTGVTIDARTRTARVIGGTVWSEVIDAAAEHGLTGLHGSSGNVGVVGLALSGGLSFYGRTHGLTVNSVRAVELVTADGELHRVDAEHDAELFWALRGGNGNFGVVTAIELHLVPLIDVFAGMLLWDREHSPEVMRAWRDLTVGAPESVTSSLRMLSFPPLPDLPPFLAGRDVVVIDGAILDTDDAASALLAPLRALSPEIDTFHRIPARELLAMHMDPQQPTPGVSSDLVLSELPDEAVDALLSVVGPGTHSGLLIAELRQLGGAFSLRAEGGGAISNIDGGYALAAIAIAPTPEAAAHGRAAGAALCAAIAEWSLPASHALTFAENPIAADLAYGSAMDRLTRESARVDPHEAMAAGHSIR